MASPSTGDLARAHALVSGRVQGVFYRASTVEAARALGLAGWVRNLADGRVELVAQGPRAQVERLLDRCREGPPAARVDEVVITWQDPEETGPGFHAVG